MDGEAKELFIDEGKCGMFFTPESEEELVRNILYVCEHPDDVKVWAENARNYVDKKFNRNSIAENFFRLLTENKN